MDGLEYYGQVNFLKGGILFADRVTTVSPRYAKEIQTPEFGCGLEGVVQTRAEDLFGLINGVDTAVWNPGSDAMLPARYSAANLAGKKDCRRALLRQCGFDPLFGGTDLWHGLPADRAEGDRSRARQRRTSSPSGNAGSWSSGRATSGWSAICATSPPPTRRMYTCAPSWTRP